MITGSSLTVFSSGIASFADAVSSFTDVADSFELSSAPPNTEIITIIITIQITEPLPTESRQVHTCG